jgi:two-component system invasion response regulator UvrY
MKPIRVLIADDHPLIMVGLTSALEGRDIKVAACVTEANEVVSNYSESKPDVVVLDIRFGAGPTGFDVAADLLRRFPAARIVFYSQFDQDETIAEAYRIGGRAFVPKNAAPTVLADAIKKAHAGEIYFLPKIAERLALIGLKADESPQSRLEPRELEVFRMMAQGLTNAEIAEKLHVTARTVSAISSAVKDKLGLSRQAEITLLAVKHLMIEP